MQISPELKTSLIPLRDFFKNPKKSSFKLSPKGTHLAFMAPYKNRKNIFVQEIGQEAVRITEELDRDIAGFFWKTDDRLIYLRDNKGDENYHLYVANKNGENARDLTPFPEVRASIVDSLPDIDDEVLVAMNQSSPSVFDVYRLNIVTGKITMVAENPGDIAEWFTDHEGIVRGAVKTDGVNNTLLYRANENDAFKEVLTTNFREAVDPLFFTFDNKQLYAKSNIGRDKQAIVLIDLENGKEVKEIFSHPDVDAQGLSYSRKRKVLTLAYCTTWKTEMTFLDERLKQLYSDLYNRLGDSEEVWLISANKKEDKFVVLTNSDLTAGTYYFYDTTTKELQKLAEANPWLKANDMCEMKPIQYQSRDGLTIHGYLTLPKGKELKNLPVVVNPHGGPWWRDSWGFNAEVQFLANRGYAVLQMNFRGSTGYGRKFWEASFKQWGRTMQNDITDGVQWLINQEIGHPNKIAIYGASYGGYATLAGVTYTPDLYACAIDYVGVSNLFSFLNTIPEYWKPMLEMMHEMVGHPEQDAQEMRAYSPVFHADKIKTPLFVAQGAKDPRVNIDESDQIVAAMKEHGVEVQYMVKENEGHGFHNEENKFEFYEAMEKFLAEHMLID